MGNIRQWAVHVLLEELLGTILPYNVGRLQRVNDDRLKRLQHPAIYFSCRRFFSFSDPKNCLGSQTGDAWRILNIAVMLPQLTNPCLPCHSRLPVRLALEHFRPPTCLQILFMIKYVHASVKAEWTEVRTNQEALTNILRMQAHRESHGRIVPRNTSLDNG